MAAEEIAKAIEEFLYEYDTYGYRDVGIDREEVVNLITIQLKELTVCQKVSEVWQNKELSADEMFDELSKILFI